MQNRFFAWKQAENQKFGYYVTELCLKAHESELGQLTESLIQHILTCGIKDSKLRERLPMQLDLNLLRMIQAGQTAEETKIQTKMYTTSEHRPAEIANIRSSKHYEKKMVACYIHHNNNAAAAVAVATA